jgi:hypothetical protein
VIASNNDRTEKFTSPTIRQKAKTRGSKSGSQDDTLFSEASNSDDVGLHAPSTDVHTPAVKVCVKSENLRLFAAMFPDGKEQSSRQFSWKHFLQVMVDAGFSVTQCSGSAVSFKANNQAIVFHQPHPETTIDPAILLSMGKRLRKWFGWTSDTFELSEKVSASL